METYRIEGLGFTYPLKDKPALSNINLNIDSGEFITICGKSGSGKSTLIRQLKPVLTPHGEKTGRIYFLGSSLDKLDHRTESSKIGYVLQNPDNQIVTDKVWHELAFGLENLGYDNSTIRLRVAEMASFFGIHNWFHKKVSELSGGQKQILNLASIMAMQPSVLILDEPTSQLDPIAAVDFLETVKKINRELGITVIMTEHRLEEVIPMLDRIIVMDKGCIIADDIPRNVAQVLKDLGHTMFFSMTSAMQIYSGVDNILPTPITVNEGRRWIDNFSKNKITSTDFILEDEENTYMLNKKVISLKEVWFKYEKGLPDVVKDLSLEIKQGDFYCILGGNGTGKTTALSLISGINKPYRGKVIIENKSIGILPQNPQNLFVKKTVKLDLYEALIDKKIKKEDKEKKIEDMVRLVELGELLNMHPYDLSGGEQQRAALAKVLLREPEILLLDEPTKGLDNHFKEKLATILRKLNKEGVTIVIVSHDLEFCAKHGRTCAMFFDGNIISSNNTKDFFSGNNFYTTSANRIARHIYSKAVTIEDVIKLCKKMS